jgi:hypothetical protein
MLYVLLQGWRLSCIFDVLKGTGINTYIANFRFKKMNVFNY